MERRTVLRWLVAASAAATGACAEAREPRTTGTPRSSLAPSPGRASPRSADQPEGVAQRSAQPGPEPVRLTVICRDEWGARPPNGSFPEHTVTTSTVHHSAVPHTDPEEGAARARQHQRYHQEAGFADLAYHHLVDRDGDIYEGRPVTAPGETFTDYDPTGHYLPCLEGDFDRQAPSEAQLDALVGLLAWAADGFGIDPATIAGHRAYASTSCPGDALQVLLDDGTIVRRVQERLAAGGVELVDGCA